MQSALASTTKVWRAAPVEELCAQLPDAPAASLRQAVTHALARTWPAGAGTLIDWPRQPEEAAREEEDEDGDLGPRESRTPHDARLRDLPGPVVQITTLREYHVHDRELLVKTATTQGWTPLPATELDGDDPDDIVGAVMHLSRYDEVIDGADNVTDQSAGYQLRIEDGDEVADWSAEPVIAEFGTGWRLSAQETDKRSIGTAWGDIPDFATLFSVTEHDCGGEECGDCGWQLTPRTADLLHTALTVLAGQAYDEAEALGDRPVAAEENGDWEFFARLPKLTRGCDFQWRRRMARALDDLADDLEHGHWPEPTCTAEELALHLALGEAPGYLDDVDDNEGSPHRKLPVHDDDYDFDACKDLLFQDSDVLMLYSPRFDGIEDPDGDVNRQFGIGDLRPAVWFEPFDNVEARDPHRGFRR
ncbi:hypothetical protein OG401_30415 [Kitasatospora purpeofusca]|uniref:hypothetical protein n=1 Tax=Kitasatospora TaxID=2063 RepID=UPI002258549E|nr:hypothetical protein [Kitasatospora purpeofusca]MCX4688561.1 hypothetical protein [Kitasatospora purpeofusca]